MTSLGPPVANRNDPAWSQVTGGSLPSLGLPDTSMPRMLTELPTYSSQRDAVMPYMPLYDANRFGQPGISMPPSGPLSGAPFNNGPYPGDRALSAADLGMPTGMQVDHPSTAANVSITYPYALLDMQNAPHRDPMDGQVLLIYHRGHRVNPRDGHGIPGVNDAGYEAWMNYGENERQVGVTLAVANAILAEDPHPNTPKDVRSVEDVLDEWSLHGFPVTEEGEKQSTRGNEQYRSRMVNTGIRGIADAFDVWSTDRQRVDAGTKLWLILKKVPAPKRYVLDAAGTFVREFKGGELGNKGFTLRPFQFEPWASALHEVPPLKALEYTNEFGRKELGRPLLVGTVRDPPMYYGTTPGGLKPHINASHVPKLPKMEVVVQGRCA